MWLQDSRSEQQAERPSLFISDEMMLQPQPHIDLLIRNQKKKVERLMTLALVEERFSVVSLSDRLGEEFESQVVPSKERSVPRRKLPWKVKLCQRSTASHLISRKSS